jgi:REP element-mobilizing transposase RayT
MARVARRDAPGAVHHVLLRGIERQRIFRNDDDREDFLARLGRQALESAAAFLAWALMPNHAHLVLRTGNRPLSEVMRRLNTGYARGFNLRHQRTGYLFQDRFRSILVEDDAYLRALLRYVHLNPLRAGLVRSIEELARYPWTGHAGLMGAAERGFQAVDEVLGWFAPERRAARRELCRWMHEGQLGDGNRLALPPAERVAPAGALRAPQPSTPLPVVASADAKPPEVRANEYWLRGWTLDGLVAWVCAELGAEPARVRSGGRRRPESDARAVIGLLATRELGSSVLEASQATGVTMGPMSRSIRRGEALVSQLGVRLPAVPPRER